MSAVQTTHPASRAIYAVLSELSLASIDATRDPGSFYPQPCGVLVGLPELTARGAYSRTFAIQVLVVSGDPLNSELAVDRLYALADDAALALRVDTYRVTSYRSGVNAEPLPALELTAVVTVTETPETEVA
jgi:hypothetical protein